MIWNTFEDEENIRFVSTLGYTPSISLRYAPPTPSFRGIDNLTTMTHTAITDSIRGSAKGTLGIGIIALGVGILIGTRGAGYKPAGIIMNTGLQVVGEAYE